MRSKAPPRLRQDHWNCPSPLGLPRPDVRRRLTWTLLHLGRFEEALETARGREAEDVLLDPMIERATRLAGGDGKPTADAALSFLTQSGAIALRSRIVPARARLYEDAMDPES